MKAASMPKYMKSSCLALFTLMLGVGTYCWAWGFELSQTKQQLGLEYALSAIDRDGVVSISLTISDLGKLDPLEGAVLTMHTDQDGKKQALRVPMALKEKDGKLVAWAQLSREFADHASIELVPVDPPDGVKVFGWVYYPIQIKPFITAEQVDP